MHAQDTPTFASLPRPTLCMSCHINGHFSSCHHEQDPVGFRGSGPLFDRVHSTGSARRDGSEESLAGGNGGGYDEVNSYIEVRAFEVCVRVCCRKGACMPCSPPVFSSTRPHLPSLPPSLLPSLSPLTNTVAATTHPRARAHQHRPGTPPGAASPGEDEA